MAAVQGWRGRVTHNLVVATVHRWTLSWRADIFDATNMGQPLDVTAPTGGAGYAGGIMDVDVSLDAFYETGDDPFDTGAGTGACFVPGQIVACTLDLDTDDTISTRSFELDNVLVVTARNDASVRDITRVSLTGKLTVPRTVGASRLPVTFVN